MLSFLAAPARRRSSPPFVPRQGGKRDKFEAAPASCHTTRKGAIHLADGLSKLASAGIIRGGNAEIDMKTTYRILLTAALFAGIALVSSEASAAVPMAVAPGALATPSFVEKTVVVVRRRPVAVVRRPVVRRPVVVR
jgi:hypothetical protein